MIAKLVSFFKSLSPLLWAGLLLPIFSGCATGDKTYFSRVPDPYSVTVLPRLDVPPGGILTPAPETSSTSSDPISGTVRASGIISARYQKIDEADRVFLEKIGAEQRDPNIRKIIGRENNALGDSILLEKIISGVEEGDNPDDFTLSRE